jgi:AraC-like DNA-binding protein
MFLLHLFFTEHLALYNYWYIASSDYPNGLIHFNLIINLISGFCYLSLCLYQLKRFNERIKNLYSNIDRINFKWLAHLIIGFLIVLLIGIVYLLLTKVFHIIIRYSINFYIYGSITIFIYFIGYYSLKRKGMFFNIDEDILLETTEHETGEIIVAKNKYNIYGLKKTDAAQLKEKLLNYMVEKKPYLDSNLSLSELASQLGIYSHYLTQVLNDELNQNFYDFVNSYRIDEVKRLLFETKYINYTLFAIALEAGFNSKSTFNRIFKKITGISPSNFKNAIKKR